MTLKCQLLTFHNQGVGFAEVENEQRLKEKGKYDFLED